MPPIDFLPALLIATLIGYLFGSIPTAVLISRLRGVDIFSVGAGLAGATNVFRQVGPVEGTAVFLIDGAKGALTIGVASRLGVDGELVLVPAMAALLGHWRSLFTRFRGGDGVSTLVGITVAIFPLYGLLSMFIAIGGAAVARLAGQPVPSLWGGTLGYGFLLFRLPALEGNDTLAFGVVLLALTVLAHGVLGHRRRRPA